MRPPVTLILLAATLAIPMAAAPTAAPASAVRLCAGHSVTINLNDPNAPDPRRAAADVVLGTPERDVIHTGAGDDTVCARESSDRVHLGPGNDLVRGGDGYDLLDGGPGNDTLIGGAHYDRAIYRNAPRPVTIRLAVTGSQVTGFGSDTLTGISDVSGARDFANTILGHGGKNAITGGDADDVLRGRGGNDFLDGEAGVDLCRGGTGRNTFEDCEPDDGR